MDDLIQRRPHLKDKILQKLENGSLIKSREVSRMWQGLIDEKHYSWIHIVQIPSILSAGNTYLHLAAKYRQTAMFINIINEEDEKDPVNESGESPYLVACRAGSVRIIEFLFKKSEEFKIDFNRIPTNNSTPFRLACIGGNTELAELIMKHSLKLQIHSFGMNRFGTNAFHDACKLGNLDIVQMMIKNSASTNNIELNAVDRENQTALHLACDRKKPEVAKLLIEKASELKLDLNARARYSNMTAFQMACGSGLASVVKIMLSESSKFNFSGGFSLACKKGHINVVEMLINKSEESPKFEIITKDVDSALLYASRAMHIKIVEILMNKAGSLKLDLSGKQFGKTGVKMAQVPESDSE